MRTRPPILVAMLLLAAGAGGLALLVAPPGVPETPERVPGGDRPAAAGPRPQNAAVPPPARGVTVQGTGEPGPDVGSWPQFRGPNRDGRLPDATGLFRSWPAGGPVKLWEIQVGEGHAGPVVHRGRVYLMDYDRGARQDALRCLSLADGREIWRFTYPVKVKRNHGMSRTVPAVNDRVAVAMGPKCQVYAVNAKTGRLLWMKDLVAEYGARVPPWYAGQCPLLDGDRVIVAPGGDPLMLAIRAETGEVIWRTPNPGGWGMTHSSVLRFEHPDGAQYVYCTTRGVVGVSVADGRLLWKFPAWQIRIALIPTPVAVSPTRLFFTGGYNAGSLLAEIRREQGAWRVRTVGRWKSNVFSCEQQTPVFFNGCLYGPDARTGGRFACFDLGTGTVRWRTGKGRRFGLGPFVVAGDLTFALEDESGTLVLARISPAGWQELASAKVLDGQDAWGPMALAGGRLLVRDLTHLACLEVGKTPARAMARKPRAKSATGGRP